MKSDKFTFEESSLFKMRTNLFSDQTLKQDISAILPSVIKWRRHFHKYPEVGFQETDTSNYIVKILNEIGFTDSNIEKHLGKTGIVAILQGSYSGPVIALRSNIDALPIQEKSKMSYQSQRDEVMHACGHDSHASILLGVAAVLYKYRKYIQGMIKFIFQPAEEIFEGARAMIKDGVLEHPKVDYIIGYHTSVRLPPHHISFKSGQITSGMTKFRLSITGKNGHGSHPSSGINAIVALSDLIEDITREGTTLTSPDITSINIGIIRGGTTENIIPDHSYAMGSFRTWTDADQEQIIQNIQKMCKKISVKYKVRIKLEIDPSSVPIQNDASLIDFLYPIVKLTTRSYDQTIMSTGSEDFGEYIKYIPGVFFWLGCRPSHGELSLPHTPSFDIDESSMKTGVRLLVNSILYPDWSYYAK